MATKIVKVLALKKQLLNGAGVDGGEMDMDRGKYKGKYKSDEGQGSDWGKVRCLDYVLRKSLFEKTC